MFENLGDDFPFDWLVKRFQKENIVDIFVIQEIVYFLTYFFTKE